MDSSHSELKRKVTDCKNLNDLIKTQNDKIETLCEENKDLKSQNRTLEKELLEAQEEMLRLMVDISGMAESPCETHEQLRTKIAQIMMLVCEGKSEQARWDTSVNIPITDCRRLGTYTKIKKRIVRICFLFMKHKTCLLSRKYHLPLGIYADEPYPDAIKQKHTILRPILKLAQSKEQFKGKCKLEYDQLIIKGKQYTTNSLDKLPGEFAPYKVAHRTSDTCLVFHGHTPL